jgi:hypothetical protein
MKQKEIAIAVALSATMLTAVFATTPLAYGDTEIIVGSTSINVERSAVNQLNTGETTSEGSSGATNGGNACETCTATNSADD